jgi:caffeoyl-CoA O-methyltransferase
VSDTPTPKSFQLGSEIHRYLVDHGTPPDRILTDLIADTMALGDISLMQIAPEQGAFLQLLTAAIGARYAVEVGTFTGYSALCIARGLEADGTLVCCDLNEEWTSIGQRHWERAGVDDRIDLRLGPALETLRALDDEPVIDLAFIDADKVSYLPYFEQLVPRMRTNGLILVDNVLWFGMVVDDNAQDDDTIAIRAFNQAAAQDERVEAVMLPIGDGLSLFRKR